MSATQDNGPTVVYDLAGHDSALRVALVEAGVGRWMAVRDLLDDTGDNWSLRTSRSQVIASAVARTDIISRWSQEERSNPDALMMRARVATERVLIAHRQQQQLDEPQPVAHSAVVSARQVCENASQVNKADPVPWICQVALAPLDRNHLTSRQPAPPGSLLPPGPWGLLQQVDGRHLGNREAHHRLVRFIEDDPVVVADYLAWLDTWVPTQVPGSPLLVLPLHVHAARRQADDDQLAHLRWQTALMRSLTNTAWEGWFLRAPLDERSALDLNYLAHALFAAFELAKADKVFQAIGPYATKLPWALVADDPESAFLKARDQCRWTVANML
ncbi:hypothetical protein ACEZDB_32410 [Streptacidiphilus sp. N1-3]|uniref:Uncharacterized protein n=1 Tax=Streptacidiphilus alkalitolerans TaxID=3342712 RepID=A0ABV6XAW6_9ACTN